MATQAEIKAATEKYRGEWDNPDIDTTDILNRMRADPVMTGGISPSWAEHVLGPRNLGEKRKAARLALAQERRLSAQKKEASRLALAQERRLVAQKKETEKETARKNKAALRLVRENESKEKTAERAKIKLTQKAKRIAEKEEAQNIRDALEISRKNERERKAALNDCLAQERAEIAKRRLAMAEQRLELDKEKARLRAELTVGSRGRAARREQKRQERLVVAANRDDSPLRSEGEGVGNSIKNRKAATAKYRAADESVNRLPALNAISAAWLDPAINDSEVFSKARSLGLFPSFIAKVIGVRPGVYERRARGEALARSSGSGALNESEQVELDDLVEQLAPDWMDATIDTHWVKAQIWNAGLTYLFLHRELGERPYMTKKRESADRSKIQNREEGQNQEEVAT
jgi:hypothetical protein